MGNSASALPYSIGTQVKTLRDGWGLCEGSRKSDGASVSVFQAKKPQMHKTPLDPRYPQLMQAPVAEHHFQHCKKLRHPHILKVYATLDTDNPTDTGGTAAATVDTKKKPQTTGDWIIVTEPCVPLQDWLDNGPKPHELAWGLQSVIEALVFLHNSAKLAHGNISPDSFFVTLGGDVKLWNFGLVTSVENLTMNRHFRDYEALVCPNAYRSPERRESRWDAVAASAVHAMDSYSVGILIGHFYNDNIPPHLQKAVQRLQTNNIKARPRLAPLLKCPVFATPYQQAQKMLEEMTVQPVEAKVAFWQNLPNMLEQRVLDEPVAKYKILPLMKQSITTICESDAMMSQDLYRREVLAILPPLFFIAETYLSKEPELVAKELSPIIALLFGVNDRGVRGALLGRVNLFVSHMDKNQLNSAVFEPMCSGFSDSSPALRELTLKATIVLVPHLTPPNLEKLSRYLVRLQSDPETSIRTNTVIFICKLAPHLTEMNRQKMLLPAYVRAMKDGFEPCRLAALQSLLKSKEFFAPDAVATKVLPAVMPQLLDPAAGVRREAFAVVDSFMQVLKQEDQRMSAAAAAAANPTPGMAAPQAVTAPVASSSAPVVTAPAPASGGYLSGFSSWMSSSAKPTEEPGAAAAAAAPPATAPPVYNAAPPRAAHFNAAPPPAAPPAVASLSLNDDDFGGDDDGWGDDDDDLLDLGNTPVKNKPLVSPMNNAWNDTGDEDDFFASFDTSKPKPASKIMSSGGKLAMPPPRKPPKQKHKPEIKKLAMDDNDDWDDF